MLCPFSSRNFNEGVPYLPRFKGFCVEESVDKKWSVNGRSHVVTGGPYYCIRFGDKDLPQLVE